MTGQDQQKFYQMLGERIKNARTKAGLKQEAFAACLNLSRASIVNIEKGRQHPPLHLLWVISNVLKIEVTELLPQFHVIEKVSPVLEKIIDKELKQANADKKTQKIIKGFVEKFIIEKQSPS